VADVRQRLRVALVAVLDTAAAIAALTGRASDNVVAWNALALAPKPCIAYRIVDCRENPESGEGWDARVQFTTVADGDDADETVEELQGAIRETLTAPALLAAGLDASPLRWNRFDGDTDDQGEGDDVRLQSQNLHVTHGDVELSITA
jgi:hypothetical protein